MDGTRGCLNIQRPTVPWRGCRETGRWLYIEVALTLFTGIVGIGHHYYGIGTPAYWRWLGAVFGALEPIPIALMTYDALHSMPHRRVPPANSVAGFAGHPHLAMEGPAAAGGPMTDDEALRHQIAVRAYARYCERGSIPGFEMDDWLLAEREVLAKRATPPTDRSKVPGAGGRGERRAKREATVRR